MTGVVEKKLIRASHGVPRQECCIERMRNPTAFLVGQNLAANSELQKSGREHHEIANTYGD